MPSVENKQTISISKSSKVKIGDVQNVVHVSADTHNQVDQVFKLIAKEIKKLPKKATKEGAETALLSLKKEALKGSQAQERPIRKWLNFLLETAPDVGEVALRTFQNPVDGISLVFQKVAQKVKEERIRKPSSSKPCL